MDALLDPHSIALIGASQDPGRIGGMPLDLLTHFGYEGGIYPINPKYESVFGLRCWPDVESLPAAVDLAVLAIGAEDVIGMLRRCHAVGIPAAIVYAAGFAESGENGALRQQELAQFGQESGMAIAGPNCMGFANLNTQAHTAFASIFKMATPQKGDGNVSLLTQSGNVCSALYGLGRRLDLKFSHFINTGNEACLDLSAYLEYLVEDKKTDVVLTYIEQLRDGARFVRACHALARQDKVLIAMKSGATTKGALAVRSHTSALAGNHHVYRAALRQLRVIEADDFAQMIWLAKLAGLRHKHAGRRVAVVSMSGALGAILTDKFTTAGLLLPDLPTAVQALLRREIPDYGMVSNPVDLTGNIINQPGVVRKVLTALADMDTVDTVVVYAPGYMLDRMAQPLIETAHTHARLFVAIDTGTAQCRDALRAADIAVFDDLGLACSSLAPYLHWCEERKRPFTQNTVPQTASTSVTLPCNEAQARAWLQAHGMPMHSVRIAQNAMHAVAAAHELGFPVVMKILSPDIAHKTEVGGVVLHVDSDQAVQDAWRQLMAIQHPTARIQGVLIQAMETGVLELIVGATRDPVFGSILTVGLGGVLTEIYQDVSHRMLPVDAAMARDMLMELKAWPLFEGWRGQPAADVQATCQAIVAISCAMTVAAPCIGEIEVNPLLVKPVGQGVAVLDALLLPTSQ